MKDIFKDAYFGKQYITKSNKKAIFWETTPEGDYILIREDVFKVFVYDKEGRDINCSSEDDITQELTECNHGIISGEQIRQEALKREESCPKDMKNSYYYGFREGAKWMQKLYNNIEQTNEL